MRTVPFKSVFDRAVGLYDFDPRTQIPSEFANSLVEHINRRVRTICQVWPWPEWILTEERAFRQVWNANHQYLRASITDGQPDEVFYIPNTTYYRVRSDAIGDPPVGTIPSTGTDYFEVISPVDTFIAYDQVCKRAIGTVLGIYKRDPRVPTGSNNGLYRFMPSERGIDVSDAGGPTVFINYKMPVPRYTITPYVSGKVYPKTEIVFDPTIGECFQALTNTNTLPSNTDAWRRIPFPEVWENYVCWGAFSDCLMESKKEGNTNIQERIALSQNAGNKAEGYIRSEIDNLYAQGQKFFYNVYRGPIGSWCYSQPWSGGTVSTLTDVCDDELGWIYPTPSITPQVSWRYYNLIVALRLSDASPSLDQISTRYLLPDSLAQIVITEGTERTPMTFILEAGASDPLDPNGQVNPIDYNASTNSKHWRRLS